MKTINPDQFLVRTRTRILIVVLVSLLLRRVHGHLEAVRLSVGVVIQADEVYLMDGVVVEVVDVEEDGSLLVGTDVDTGWTMIRCILDIRT